ncbi:MAG: hypothetical protein QOJ43_2664 [Gaiellaceae bacterium]|nr:hypothetical protein [Gaiellaceae bacterium]
MAAHPVRLVVDDDLRRTRLTVFFRLLLAIPHLIWLALWTIGVVILGFVAWVIALVRGRLPDGLHDFLAMYVRYATHLGAYLALAADPYPGFTGKPGYPVDIEIPGPQAQSRATIAVRLLLAIPALILSATLGSGAGGGYASRQGGNSQFASSTGVGGVAAVCGFLGWFASLARGRMPNGLRDLGAYGIGYTAQASAYTLLLTDRYPNADPDELGPTWSLPPHPVRLLLDDDGRRSRLTVAFRLLLVLPHLVWLLLWSVAASLAAIANWFVALVRGRSAAPLHRFLAAYTRYSVHVSGFLFLVANPFPGFTGAPGYPVDVAIEEPESQNRWITLFRILLALPAFLIGGALFGALAVAGLLGWFAALVTGRMPTGLRNLGAVAIRYQAQTDVYWLVLNDRYPYASPAVQPPPVEAEI